ncbi:MAG: zinc-ribbon domain-containing protein, partial [Anaeromyxobacteraceae bacterium]
MRITCPQCQAGYDVDPEKIPTTGLRVRCPQCERVFSVRMAAHATTLSGQPSATGPVPTMPGAPPPAPGGAAGPRAGMTMVGMVPPQAPG